MNQAAENEINEGDVPLFPEQDFWGAYAEFQRRCPNIPKKKEVYFKDTDKVKYRYAPLEDMLEIIDPLLKELKFVRYWTTEEREDGLMVVCHIRHIPTGEEHTSPFPVPRATGYGTNVSQDQGSANTLGRRISLSNALGIIIQEDDDGSLAATPNHEILIRHNNIARDWLASILAIKDAFAEDNIEAAAECYAEFPRQVMLTLNVAPSAGGLFTTAERNRIKTDKEFQTLVHQHCKESGWYDRKENQL